MDEWPAKPDHIAKILDDFTRPAGPQALIGAMSIGDRRQEIVFIGIDMDQSALESMLDSCLLTDHEMQVRCAPASRSSVLSRLLCVPLSCRPSVC